MKFSIKKLKGTKVYFFDQEEPWGVFSDVALEKNGKIAAYIVKTLSIVPISKAVQRQDIDRIEFGRIVLKKGVKLINYELFKKAYCDNPIKAENVNKVFSNDKNSLRLKDMQFEFETGEMCDVIVSENIIIGKHRISVNKISAKDNTIYIAELNKGGNNDV